MPEPDDSLAKDRQRLREVQEELKRQDLATFDHQANVHLFKELLEVGYRIHKATATEEEDPMKNGLVEFHRKLRGSRPEIKSPSASSLPPPA